MNKIRDFLKGKKTYLTALAAAVASAVAFSQDALTDQEFITAIVAAVLACTIGAKIDRSG